MLSSFIIFHFNKYVCDCETYVTKFTKERTERKQKRKEIEKEEKGRIGAFKDKLGEHSLLLQYL